MISNKDSNGLKLSEEQKAYFKNTKIVDKEGNILHVYHGSPKKNIEHFDIDYAGKSRQCDDHAIFFTNDYATAESFSYEPLPCAGFLFNQKGEQGEIYDVYLNIENPFDFEYVSEEMMEQLFFAQKEDFFERDIKKYTERTKRILGMGNHKLVKTFTDLRKLERLGYDGIIANMDIHQKVKEYGIFHADQVKSVFNGNPIKSIYLMDDKVQTIRRKKSIRI